MRSLNTFFPLPEKDNQYPPPFIVKNSVIKLDETEELVQIGLCNDNQGLKEDLQAFHHQKVIFHLIRKDELTSYLARKLSDTGDLSNSGSKDERLKLDKLVNEAPIVNLVNSIIIDAIGLDASDIHIESLGEKFWVRYRIDGILLNDREVPPSYGPSLSSRIKIMANLNIMERRLPQDGRINVYLDGHHLDLRVSILPLSRGESIVLRLLNRRKFPLKLESLGFSSWELEHIGKLLLNQNGLILLSGPTGSGKTTTLNAIIEELNNQEKKIITIEDPVEYEIEGVDQIQTNEKIGLTFESLLRRVLRQDPDIIMVGEIRDKITAQLAVRAAMTGHLVLTTVHTNDAPSVVDRLVNMGIEPYLLAGVLRGVIAQRLVRRLCPTCSPLKTLERGKRPVVKDHSKNDKSGTPRGCVDCGQRGYRGRLILSESFICTDSVDQIIGEGKGSRQLSNHLKENGFISLEKDGLIKVSQGLTSVNEVEKAVII